MKFDKLQKQKHEKRRGAAVHPGPEVEAAVEAFSTGVRGVQRWWLWKSGGAAAKAGEKTPGRRGTAPQPFVVVVVLLQRPVVVVDLLRRPVVLVELPWRERSLLRRDRAEEDGRDPRMGTASIDVGARRRPGRERRRPTGILAGWGETKT